MTCLSVSKEQYKSIVEKPFCGFDSAEFVELNKHKVNKVKYFIFGDKANHFALVAGIKDKVLKCPFSATFGIFSEIRQNNQINYYYDAISALVAWCKDNSVEKIIFATPPLFYNQAHITKFQNALFCAGFKVLHYDMNFELQNTKEYNSIIGSDSRRKLKIAHKHNLTFEKTSDLAKVYDIIRANRQERGFPLWLSQKDIDETAKLIKSDYFLVFDSGEAIASAYIQHITQNAVNIVYWGNLAQSNELCPMNFLAEQIYQHYQQSSAVKYISIGTSTLDSVANVGLCYFKESIGCVASPKLSFVLDMTQDSTLFVATATCGGGELTLIYFSFSFSLSGATFSFSFLIIDFIQSKAFYDTH